MKRKLPLLFALLLFLLSIKPVEATSGRIGKGKLQNCSGQLYGRHGADEHWHMAEQKGDYWYAVGADLGYTNPCPTTPEPAPTPAPVATPEKKPATTAKPESLKQGTTTTIQATADKVTVKGPSQAEIKANEENAKIEKENQEKIEKERIAKVEAEKAALKKEEALKSNTAIKNISLAGYALSPNSVSFYSNLEKEMKVALINDEASYTIDSDIQIKPFVLEDIEVSVTSANKKITKDYTFKVAKLGSQHDIGSQDLTLKLGDITYNYIEGQFSIPSKDFTNISDVEAELFINTIRVTDIDFDTINDNGVIQFVLGDQTYTLATEIIEDDSLLLGIGVASLTAIVGGTSFLKIRKKSIKGR